MGIFMSMYKYFFNNEPMRILMVGLDAAGKTTILYRLKLGGSVTTIPTIGFNVETLTVKEGLEFIVWDISTNDRTRRLLVHYCPDTKGIILVVDSNDRERLPEALETLTVLLEGPYMKEVPLLVLANKQDIENAATCDEITKALHLDELSTKRYPRKWHIHPTCATKGEGLMEALEVLAEYTTEYIATRKH